MTQAVVVKCPGCQRELRVPTEMIDKKIRCKFCSITFEARKKSRIPIAKPGRTPPAEEVEDLTELEPIDAPRGRSAPPVAPPPLPQQASYPTASTVAQYTDGEYAPAFNAADRHVGRGRYRGPSRGNTLTWIVVALAGLVMTALVVVILVKPDLFGKKEDPPEVVSNHGNPENGGTTEGGEKPKVETPKPPIKNPTKTGAFPRRLLSINISNYLFVNPVHYGDSRAAKDRRDTHGSVTKLVNSWKIPADQVYELTDGPSGEEGASRGAMEKFPMKSNVMKTIELFCETSRAQDRIIFLFSGHAYEKDGKAFLVPIEGEFDQPETLIPLAEVYEKFAACKAQEKLIIWDVCRYNPDRGVERPSFGKMTEGLEKALHSQPAGVIVWTACSKDQYSYEFDYANAGPKDTEVNGSVFLSHFRLASAAGMLNKTGKKGAGGISSPEDPIPYKPLIDWVSAEVAAFVPLVAKGEKQTPKFTGTDAPSVEYDPKEALAARFEIPKIAQGADSKEIAGIFAELKLPPLKALRKDGGAAPEYDVAFPFSAEAMQKYKSDGVTLEQIKADPEKFKLRAKVVEAFEELRELQQKAGTELPEEFRSPISDAEKKKILNIQREPARRQATLRNLKTTLEAIAPLKEKETPRWQANYDYVLAQVKFRYAYLSEYDLALGKVKLEALPALDGKKGWKLAAAEKMKAPKDIRDMAEEARVSLGELIANHPNTPWSLVAKREKNFALGLEWQASSFGAE